jgi:hypothetical protein
MRREASATTSSASELRSGTSLFPMSARSAVFIGSGQKGLVSFGLPGAVSETTGPETPSSTLPTLFFYLYVE